MHISFETVNNVYFGSLKTGKFQKVNSKIANLRDQAVHTKTVSFSGREVAILSKDSGLREQGLTDELSKANFRYLDYRGLDLKHKWDRLALNYLMTNAKVIPVEGKMYVAKTIGDISYEDRRNSFFVDRNPENQQTVHPIFSTNGYNPETLAKYGWERLPARFETEDEAKSSPFYQVFLKLTELRNSGEYASIFIDGMILHLLQKEYNLDRAIEALHSFLKLINTPEHFLKKLTARDRIAPSFNRSEYISNLHESNSFPDNMNIQLLNPNRIYGLIKKGKEIQDSVIFTQNNQISSTAAVVKLTGRQIYLLTPEENQSAFDFDTLPVSKLLNCYQNTWKNYIFDLFPEELDAHALQTLRVMITETDRDMKIMSDFVNELSLVITLENKQGAVSAVSTTHSTPDSTPDSSETKNTKKSKKRPATDSSEAISTTQKKLKTKSTTISKNSANEDYCVLKDIQELKDRVIEFQSLYLERLLLKKHIDFYTVKCIQCLHKILVENTAMDNAMLSKTKSKVDDLKKELKVTYAKIGLQPALWEPLLTHVSSRLAKKYSEEHDAVQKDKQFELLSEHAHQIQSLITRTKLVKAATSSHNIEALDLAKAHLNSNQKIFQG